jgi:PAS domain S-box-containing protein
MSIDDPQKAVAAPIEVLHIDDDSGFLDLTEAFLTKELEQATITTAVGAEDGLERLANERFHCVVCDYDMPGQNGLEVLEAVRAEYPELPFILYTGKGSEEIAAEAINAGVTGYLQKGGPDQHRRLANRIKHAAAEYRSRIESERYSTVLQALNYPIYVVDANAEFEYVNNALLKLTGYNREEIIGSQPELIKTDEAVEMANGMLSEIVSSSGPDTEQFRVDIHTKDGDVVPCYDHMAALPFDEEFRGSVGILRDITQEQQQKTELVRKNERLEEFTSIVSHDLRAPLNEAETAAALAQSTGDDKFFERLETQHDRMERMIEDLLTLAREGRTVSEPTPVDVTDVAAEAWEPFCGTGDSLDLPTEAIVVDGDAKRLRQLLENLLRNAVEHGSSPVTVLIGRYDDGFYVADDGPGIDEARREAVFDPGYTTADDGTGFGLTIVKRIADAHGWDVNVTGSDAGGVRFEFAVEPEVRVPVESPAES